MRNISVLGSTGSIGRQALDVVKNTPGVARVVAMSSMHGGEAMLRDILAFRPELVCVEDEAAARALRPLLPKGVRLEGGEGAAALAAAYPPADTVVNGISGFAGTLPLIAALEAGKRVALANKESIVCAGPIVERAKRGGGEIIPVDSEQSAIFQCLSAGKRSEVRRLILTASGGPFRGYSKEQLARVTAGEAMRHPTWSMGRKITLDSATLFNKGLEIIEASRLFSMDGEAIRVLVHPQSVVHSMVEYRDSAVIAQLSAPDMRLAILYALTWPQRHESGFGALDLGAVGRLEFFEPDTEAFPAIPLAYEALKSGGASPTVYNAANEAAAGLFMEGKIGFTDIPALVERALAAITGGAESMEEIIYYDGEARRLVNEKAGYKG